MIIYAVFALLLASCQVSEIGADVPDVAHIEGIFYDREILAEVDRSPYQLAADYNSNYLFFSYTDSADNDTFKSAYINLNDSSLNVINGIDGGFANAVDNTRYIIYLGGSDGIYYYDTENETAVRTNITDENIWQLHVSKDVVYFTTYPTREVYKYEDGYVDLVPELAGKKVKLVAVDEDNDIYYTTKTKMYVYKNDTKKSKYVGTIKPNCLTTDKDGNIYFSAKFGIYKIDKEHDRANMVANIPDLYGLAFDNNGNIYYATEKAIVKLTPVDR